MTIDDLLVEAQGALHQIWFVRGLTVADRTHATVTTRLFQVSDFFVQVFLGERSGRFSLALIGPTGRLYGRDREHGIWHRHPFEQPRDHEPTPEGMSSRPIEQFLTEIEQILLDNDLI